MNELNIKNGLIVDGGLTATTISATTYINLPTSVDIYVTGGTYSNGTARFTNNTGGTFNVSGFNASNPSAIPHTTASGTDTYIATVSGVTGYTDGDAYLVRFTNGNTTDCTLNINSIGAINLYRNNDGKLLGGDIQNNGEMICIYNSSLNVFQCVGISPNTLFAYVTNDDSVTITKGQPVYAFSGTGDRMTVKRAKNTSDLTSAQTVGLVYSSSILPNQKGLIIIQGLLDGLNILPTSTWADGNPVYLGDTDGSITNIKPYAPNHLVYLGFVTTASNGSAGRMYVRIQNGYELDEIHNVVATGATYGDLIVYSASGANNLWVTSKTLTGTYKVNGNLNITGTTSSNSISATTISGGTLYGDGTNLTGTNTIVSNTVFVSKLGNDSTGSRTNMGKPFLTLEAALSAATSGDTIVVFPGSYTVTTTGTTGLAKDGVSWYFNPNTNVTKSTSGSLFVISGFTGSFNVLGYGNFTCNGSAGNVWQITGNRQNVNHTFEFDTATCTTTDTIRFNISGAGSYTYTTSINIRGRVCQSSGGRAIYSVFSYTSAYGLNQVINIDTIRSTNSNAIRLGDSYSVLSLTFNYCESTTTDAIWLDGMVQRVSINSGPYVAWGGSNRWAYVFGNTDGTYISSITINTAGLNAGVLNGSTNLNVSTGAGTVLQVNGFLRALTQAGGQVRGYSLGAVTISNGTLFAHHVESITMTGGLAYIDNQTNTFSGGGGVSISSGNIYIKQADVVYGNISITGGKLEVDRITFFSNNDGSYPGGLTMSSGTLRVNQYVKNLNTVLATGWALNISGGILITNNSPVFFVGNTGLGAIRHNGNFTWKLMGNVYLNTAIQATSGTITYQIGSAANVIVDANVA